MCIPPPGRSARKKWCRPMLKVRVLSVGGAVRKGSQNPPFFLSFLSSPSSLLPPSPLSRPPPRSRAAAGPGGAENSALRSEKGAFLGRGGHRSYRRALPARRAGNFWRFWHPKRCPLYKTCSSLILGVGAAPFRGAFWVLAQKAHFVGFGAPRGERGGFDACKTQP